MAAVHSNLLRQLNSIVTIDDWEASKIVKILEYEKIKAKGFLVQAHEVCNYIYYIKDGYLRIYLNNERGEEFTVHLAGPGDFVSAFSGFIQRKPNNENIQAVRQSEVLKVSFNNLQCLYQDCPRLERLGRLILEKNFIKKDLRVISLITESPEIRYKNFLKNHKDIIENVKLKFIASYLGMTPETPSRIRKKKI